MTAPTFADRRALYEQEWGTMKPDGSPDTNSAAKILVGNKTRYQKVEAAIGVPWFFVACVHWREASGSFAGVLHNGERIIGTGKKTTLVPAGRGPFATWEDAAIDALKMRGLDKTKIDSVERFAYEAEAYNGWGYYYHGVPSAYLWSHSSIYKGGKYVADGKWDATAKDAQVGVMPLLLAMMGLDASIAFAAAPAPSPQPVPTPQPTPAPTPAPTPVPSPQKPDWIGEIIRVLLEIIKAIFGLKKG